MSFRRRDVLVQAGALTLAEAAQAVGRGKSAKNDERHFLYVAVPGIRNYLEYGGLGLLVFDMDAGFKFVRRMGTWPLAAGEKAENVKGIAAHGPTGRVFISTIKRIAAFDAQSGKKLWEQAPEGGCDRMALSPTGHLLYVPSLEGPHWNVLATADGKKVAQVAPQSGAHNTVWGADGTAVYLAGLKSPLLSVADPMTHKVVRAVGPFSAPVRPFTVNAAQTLAFVNVNELLGFEIGDIKTGKKLHRVEVQGFSRGEVKRHGCPSHGIGLTPDESRLWLCDAANQRLHVFDLSKMPPRQIASVAVRDQPGWITFSLDGKYALPSTGEIIDVKTRAVVATLKDETGAAVHSEKMVEIVFRGGKPFAAGDQFGVGRKP